MTVICQLSSWGDVLMIDACGCMEHASSSSKEDDDLGMVRRGGTFTFDFVVATSYPHDAPKVKCKTKVQLEHLIQHMRCQKYCF